MWILKSDYFAPDGAFYLFLSWFSTNMSALRAFGFSACAVERPTTLVATLNEARTAVAPRLPRHSNAKAGQCAPLFPSYLCFICVHLWLQFSAIRDPQSAMKRAQCFGEGVAGTGAGAGESFGFGCDG